MSLCEKVISKLSLVSKLVLVQKFYIAMSFKINFHVYQARFHVKNFGPGLLLKQKQNAARD